MTRTQILLPDEIYQRARSVAEAKEISLAELARRGLELILDQYPPPEAIRQKWTLPLLSGMGWRGLGDAEIKVLAQKTALEEDLERAAGFDTNILFHALQADSPRHRLAREFFDSIQDDDRVVLSELVLVELYGLLRNPAVSRRPLDSTSAVEVISALRRHPRWRLLSFPPAGRDLHDRLWHFAAAPGFAFRRIYDARLALTLVDQGVTEFATANVKDFKAMGFERVWNPVEPVPAE